MNSLTGICEDCLRGYRLPGEPKGAMTTIAGHQTYLRSVTAGQRTTVCAVLFTDIYGLVIPNTQILGDEMSEKLGIDVYVPDLFNGERSSLDWSCGLHRPRASPDEARGDAAVRGRSTSPTMEFEENFGLLLGNAQECAWAHCQSLIGHHTTV
jgi:hypothetical protein